MVGRRWGELSGELRTAIERTAAGECEYVVVKCVNVCKNEKRSERAKANADKITDALFWLSFPACAAVQSSVRHHSPAQPQTKKESEGESAKVEARVKKEHRNKCS